MVITESILTLAQFNLQFHLLSLIVLTTQMPATTQDDGAGSSCTKATVQDAMAKLKTDGGGPLGFFNKNYMAFTWADAVNNFSNLITMQHLKLSASQQSSSGFPVTTVTGSCTVNQGKFPYCSACPAVTDLGPGRFPRYINEIICRNESAICGPQAEGFCKTTGLNQQLLVSTCDSSTGKEKLESYTQLIRSCCECFLF